MQTQVRLIVRGSVQGVGFRYFVYRSAEELALDGDVRNREDGAVEVRAGGDEEALRRLIERVREGPSGAAVREVEVEWGEGERLPRGFRITG